MSDIEPKNPEAPSEPEPAAFDMAGAVEIKIYYNPKLNKLQYSCPPNIVLSIGILEYTKQLIMLNQETLPVCVNVSLNEVKKKFGLRESGLVVASQIPRKPS